VSELHLELFTSDGKYVLKDSEGNIVSDEPMDKIEAVAMKKELKQGKAKVEKQTKKQPKLKSENKKK